MSIPKSKTLRIPTPGQRVLWKAHRNKQTNKQTQKMRPVRESTVGQSESTELKLAK